MLWHVHHSWVLPSKYNAIFKKKKSTNLCDSYLLVAYQLFKDIFQRAGSKKKSLTSYQLNIKALRDFILCFGRPGPGDVVDEALKKCDTGEGEYITIMFFFYFIKMTVCVIIKLLLSGK